MNSPQKITRFNGRWHFLSNFYLTPVVIFGHTWRTAEHAFQSAKLTNPEDVAKILRIPSPGSAKKFARSCQKFDDWDDRKVEIMRQVLSAKFRGSNQLWQWLLETGDAHLIEGNTWGDTFWGQVFSRGGWIGQNMLGQLLMELREELQAERIGDD